MNYFKNLERWRKHNIVNEKYLSLILLINIVYILGLFTLICFIVIKWCSKSVWDYQYEEVNIVGIAILFMSIAFILLLTGVYCDNKEKENQLIDKGYIEVKSTKYKDQLGLCYININGSFTNVDCNNFKTIEDK